jgi:RimJ/RimL family protein N-acetyltransferase
MQPLTPVDLTGALVRLEPMRREHLDALFAAAQDPAIWRFTLSDPSGSPAAMTAYMSAALDDAARGTALPFVVVRRADETVCGATRYYDLRQADGGVEIGYSWLSARARRTGINTECKLLLLTHAFEVLGASRVQFKTSSQNDISQRAIARLGATREGVLRRYQRTASGYQRDSVIYSVIADEWPEIKARLTGMLRFE